MKKQHIKAMIHRKIYTICILLLPLISFGQDFKWKAKVSDVDSSGFYSIFLKPEIISKLNRTFTDLRLYDEMKNEVPYIKRVDKIVARSDKFREYNMIHNSFKRRKGYTQIMIHNETKRIMSNIGIFYRNTDTDKTLKISGSNDKKKWLIIADNYPLLSESGVGEIAEISILDIPASDFEYYELQIYDSRNKAVEVLKTVYYEISIDDRIYSKLKKPEIIQNEQPYNNTTVVTLVFDESQYIDKLVLDIEGPAFYQRKVELSKADTAVEKKMHNSFYEETVRTFYINSQEVNTIELSRFQAKLIRLIIFNNDNPPLKIKSVNVYQVKNYLVAYFDKDHKYTLYLGNSQVEAPIYDLTYFKDSINSQLNALHCNEVLATAPTKDTKHSVINIPIIYLWITIAVVALFLVLISVGMFRDILKNQNNENKNINLDDKISGDLDQ